MKTQTDKTQESQGQSAAHSEYSSQSSRDTTYQLADNRPEANAQRKLLEQSNILSAASQPSASPFDSSLALAKTTDQSQAIIDTPLAAEQQQPLQSKNSTQGLVQRVVYNSIDDVKNTKFLPTSGNYTDEQKLEIANWCANQNNGSNSIKSAYQKAFALVYSTITDNGKEYSFTFMWDLAMHIDLGGAAHGGVDTPHLQAVPGLNGMAGSTVSQVKIDGNAADGSASREENLLYTSKDNAVFINYADLSLCMNSGNLDPVKDQFKAKIIEFSKAWASSYSDKSSGAKDERAQESDDEFGLSLFD